MPESPRHPAGPFASLPSGGQSRLLRFSVTCPVCEHAYDLQHLRIVGESDQSLLTHIQCLHCGTALLTLVAVKQGGVVAMRTVTDLTPEEVPMLDTASITEDDVLDFYTELESGDCTPERFA